MRVHVSVGSRRGDGSYELRWLSFWARTMDRMGVTDGTTPIKQGPRQRWRQGSRKSEPMKLLFANNAQDINIRLSVTPTLMVGRRADGVVTQPLTQPLSHRAV